MLTISTPASASAAASYYAKEGIEAEGGFFGRWGGKAALRMGLYGDVAAPELKEVIHNRLNGEKLTPRDRHDKKPLTDFCFSPPKSVAVAHQVMGDDRIPGVVLAAVQSVMERHVEPFIMVRLKTGGKYENQIIGNGAWALEYHKLTRPVNGWEDPGDHVHALLMNVGYLGNERRSIEVSHSVKASALLNAAFMSELAKGMKQLGYGIRTTKDGWELQGMSDSIIRKFSRRSELIELEAQRRGIKSPKGKAALGAKIREKKSTRHTEDQLRREWNWRLDSGERQMLQGVLRMAARGPNRSGAIETTQAVENTLHGLLMDKSAVTFPSLAVGTLKNYPGEVSLEGVMQAIDGMDAVKAEFDGMRYITTKEAMQRERDVLRKALKGEITLKRLKRGEKHEPKKGETVLTNPGFKELHDACQSDDLLTVLYPYRHYAAKVERGNPNVWLEDKAGLFTGQERPAEKVKQKVIRVSGQVQAKVAAKVERVKRVLEQDRGRTKTAAVRGDKERER